MSDFSVLSAERQLPLLSPTNIAYGGGGFKFTTNDDNENIMVLPS